MPFHVAIQMHLKFLKQQLRPAKRVAYVCVRVCVCVGACAGGKLVGSSRVKSAKAKLNKICLAAIQDVTRRPGQGTRTFADANTGDLTPRILMSQVWQPRPPSNCPTFWLCLPTNMRQVQQQQQRKQAESFYHDVLALISV